MLSRREIFSILGSAAVIVGFDLASKTWVSSAEAAPIASFRAVPRLDGKLLFDLSSRNADSTDQGNIVQQVPGAVLLPGSVEDIAEMVRFCRYFGVKIAARGQHHTTFGQGLTPGLIIEMSSLNTIHYIKERSADVDAGVLWADLVNQSITKGVTPPVLTAYTKLSIGGTLSVGGMSASFDQGAQIDRVRALLVVTGRGDIVWCSQEEQRDLFEVMLGGLGQCGIITRAKIDLVRAPQMARTFTLKYTNVKALFGDMRTLISRGEVSSIYAMCLPSGASSIYLLFPLIYFNPQNQPNNSQLLQGLSVSPDQAAFQDSTYIQQVSFVNGLYDGFMANQMFNQLQKPWFHVFLPDSATEQYVSDVVPGLTPTDVGPTGIVLILPVRRSKLTRPLLRVPSGGPADLIFLFEILTSASAPGSNPTFVTSMLARNRALFIKSRDLGATRYPPDSVPFDQQDWVTQYGNVWPAFLQLKRYFDPANILTPGPGIFS